MVTFKNLKNLFLINAVTIISLISFSNISAYAGSPTVIEVYGKNGCDSDTKAQDKLFEILQKDDDIILINCRRYYSDKGEDRRYTLNFCNERARKYNDKFGYSGIKTPLIVVNGKWDAFRKNMEPAVKIGKTDRVFPIKLSLHGQSLNIEIPDIESKEKTGSIFLYAYMPTQGEKEYIADPDLEVTEQIKEKLRQNKKVPFIQKVHLANFYLRPVFEYKKVGNWAGEKMNITIPLKDMIYLAGDRAKDLSYVVVIHEGSDYGTIIAAGEIKSQEEMLRSLPKSKPLEIKYMSRPTQATSP